jgi:hypothetical protein
MTKRCFKCGKEKPTTDFNKNKRRSDGINAQCKLCHSVMRKHHYENNKKKILEQVSARKKAYNVWIASLKTGPCVDCKNSYPPCVMDFDHLNNKEFNISTARACGYGKAKILKEISKCELVCSNCHRIRTHNRYADVA